MPRNFLLHHAFIPLTYHDQTESEKHLEGSVFRLHFQTEKSPNQEVIEKRLQLSLGNIVRGPL